MSSLSWQGNFVIKQISQSTFQHIDYIYRDTGPDHYLSCLITMRCLNLKRKCVFYVKGRRCVAIFNHNKRQMYGLRGVVHFDESRYNIILVYLLFDVNRSLFGLRVSRGL